MNTLLPILRALRRAEFMRASFKQWMLALLLALPLTPWTAAAQPPGGQPKLDSKLKLPPAAHAPAGFVFVPTSWCAFFPNLPGCPVQLLPGESEVTSFGSNPGNLRMFTFVPQNLAASRPLVVVLHGCTQNATNYIDETGWVQFANKFHFAMLMPQQQLVNNSSLCFRFFDSNHNQRGQGEALSIKQMIDKMLADSKLNIDKNRVYVTGLSAGGGMAAVMLATYPEIFAGGGVIAGIPDGCAKTSDEATQQCGVSLSHQAASVPVKDLTPQQWGDLVRNALVTSDPNFKGPFPRVSIWQGTADDTVNPQDETALIRQWTNLLGVSQTPQVDETIKGHTRHQVFQDNNGKAMVEAFFVQGMNHGTPIDPGPGDDQCGKPAPFVLSAGICSSFFISKFWGIIP
ncbi:hypothetical protein LMG28614_07302 [Paraburkholderia ultramafica]|uniref:Uncharacterized protein n=1 Tax=Paraburkholderia ultramafica TaxID=1544867 RepID=A0A6S7BZZ1_9BURK|nr:PHB depolymerase family esterase [Paraburkholderia ultramafica]CAB3810560.1 hypothetical protein LMG28614_07302 [Paraburkholderia ultramafica]